MLICTCVRKKAGKGNAREADSIIIGAGQGGYGLFQCQEPYCLKTFDNEGELDGIIYEHDNYEELSKIADHIEIPGLGDIEFSIDGISVKEEMYGEIELCAKSRFICGKGNAFFESLFKVYKLCGWLCEWKNGKIIVYVPANK